MHWRTTVAVLVASTAFTKVDCGKVHFRAHCRHLTSFAQAIGLTLTCPSECVFTLWMHSWRDCRRCSWVPLCRRRHWFTSRRGEPLMETFSLGRSHTIASWCSKAQGRLVVLLHPFIGCWYCQIDSLMLLSKVRHWTLACSRNTSSILA